jgi:hypothetical protein
VKNEGFDLSLSGNSIGELIYIPDLRLGEAVPRCPAPPA